MLAPLPDDTSSIKLVVFAFTGYVHSLVVRPVKLPAIGEIGPFVNNVVRRNLTAGVPVAESVN